MDREKKYIPRLIAWEITRSCHLNCRHCRAGAGSGSYENELGLEEIFKTMDSISVFGKPIIILTGGEPMLRSDLNDIISYGDNLGLIMVMSPCGKLLTENKARELKGAGLKRISISIDGASPESHDNFRGVPGAFEDALKGIEAAKRAGLQFQINTTVTKHNIHEIEDILELAIKIGAVAFSPFLLVPAGRGKDLVDMEISPRQYENILNWIYQKKQQVHINLRPTCAPHYFRILREQEKKAGRRVTSENHGLDAFTKGCMGGQSFAFISHVGMVQICGFLEIGCGNIRESGYDFQNIWETSKVLLQLRDADNYHGRCGYCEYRLVCGGCRARAYGTTGNYLDEEPYCVYQPKKKR